MVNKIIHKIKDCNRSYGLPLLINSDETWNILCRTTGSHIRGSKHWEIVNCKLCLKHKHSSHENGK